MNHRRKGYGRKIVRGEEQETKAEGRIKGIRIRKKFLWELIFADFVVLQKRIGEKQRITLVIRNPRN